MISTLYIPSWFTITSSLSVFGWNKTILQQKYSVEEFFDLDAAGLEYIFSVFNIFRYVWYSKPPCGSCFYCPVEYFECMSWMSPNDDDHGDDDYDDPYSMVMITKYFWIWNSSTRTSAMANCEWSLFQVLTCLIEYVEEGEFDTEVPTNPHTPTTTHTHTHLLIDLCNIAARCYCSRCPELEINHGVTLTLWVLVWCHIKI